MLEFPRERNGDALYGELQRLRDRVSARRDLRRRAMSARALADCAAWLGLSRVSAAAE